MIYIAGDKHGYQAMKLVTEYLNVKKIPFENLGVNNNRNDIKLEDMIPRVVKKVKENENNKAIMSCGTGVGVEVGANKFSGIRACLADSPTVAEYSIVYDKCNVLCLVGWKVTKSKVFKILDKWFTAKYDGNKDRLKMFKVFDSWC